jgi:hypothetical protein
VTGIAAMESAPMDAAAMEYVASGGAETLSREEFDEFYNRTAPALRAYIRRVSGNAAATDDFCRKRTCGCWTRPR